jgi:hypothetical protein
MHSFNLLVNMKLVFYGFKFLFSIFLLSHIPVAVISSCFSFAELISTSYLKFPVYLVAASDLCHLPNISLRIDHRFLSLCSSAICGNWMWGLWVLPRDECCEEWVREQGVEAVSCWLSQLLLIFCYIPTALALLMFSAGLTEFTLLDACLNPSPFVESFELWNPCLTLGMLNLFLPDLESTEEECSY